MVKKRGCEGGGAHRQISRSWTSWGGDSGDSLLMPHLTLSLAHFLRSSLSTLRIGLHRWHCGVRVIKIPWLICKFNEITNSANKIRNARSAAVSSCQLPVASSPLQLATVIARSTPLARCQLDCVLDAHTHTHTDSQCHTHTWVIFTLLTQAKLCDMWLRLCDCDCNCDWDWVHAC